MGMKKRPSEMLTSMNAFLRPDGIRLWTGGTYWNYRYHLRGGKEAVRERLHREVDRLLASAYGDE